ncbi:hypothetical protein [Peribacillus kribbensis]|uniref:hypothetical protein n=1 Tax=Peribacillus kribbensis TaxID=356658 RepID=UPI000407064E|nr:hypothetical protein [Peribacillus kribbensis]
MFVVYFYENKNLLLNQLLARLPEVGAPLTIKGRKGKISSVECIDDNKKYIVQVELAAVNKNKALLDPAKKKKR